MSLSKQATFGEFVKAAKDDTNEKSTEVMEIDEEEKQKNDRDTKEKTTHTNNH